MYDNMVTLDHILKLGFEIVIHEECGVLIANVQTPNGRVLNEIYALNACGLVEKTVAICWEIAKQDR
jgi:hypothetical protein